MKVSDKVKNEMSRLRTQASLVPLAVLQTDNSFQTKTILFRNVGFLHLQLNLHINDVQSDQNIQQADVNIFVELRLCLSDRDDVLQLRELTSYRND